jgi:cell division septum initiation protein DivIVA
MSDVDSLNREIERLSRVIAEQEVRIAALEKEAAQFQDIEVHLLRAISLANSEFRTIWRASRLERSS